MATKKFDLMDGEDDALAKADADGMKEELEKDDKGDESEHHSTGRALKPVDLDREDEDEGSEATEQSVSRSERRSNRYAEQKRAREQAERERDELRHRNEVLAAQLNQGNALKEIVERLPRPASSQVDPDDSELEDLVKRRNQVYALHEARGSSITQEERSEMQRQVNELMGKEQDVRIRKALRSQAPQQNSQEATRIATFKVLESQHPDIWNDERSRSLAILNHTKLLRLGKPDNIDTFAEAADVTRRELRLPARSQRQPYRPNGHTQRAMAGVSSSGAGGAPSSKKVVQPTDANKKMARGMYPALWRESPQKAFEKWAREVGADDGD
jgi:hypothetical protein